MSGSGSEAGTGDPDPGIYLPHSFLSAKGFVSVRFLNF